MKNMLYKKKKKGYSLIEMVAALGLLGVGVLSVLAVFSLGMQSSLRSARYSEASILLQRIAEEEKLEIYNTTETGNPIPATVPNTILPYTYQVLIYGFDLNNWVHKRINVLWQQGNNQESLSTEIFCTY